MTTKTKALTRVALALAAIGAVATTTMAQAETQWQQNHPRRAEVNARLANQNHRINDEYREGEISAGRAAYLHHEDHQIRTEERLMASQNGGHITKSEQRVLNQQENHVSRQIGY
jgi:hypothetical protein